MIPSETSGPANLLSDDAFEAPGLPEEKRRSSCDDENPCALQALWNGSQKWYCRCCSKRFWDGERRRDAEPTRDGQNIRGRRGGGGGSGGENNQPRFGAALGLL